MAKEIKINKSAGHQRAILSLVCTLLMTLLPVSSFAQTIYTVNSEADTSDTSNGNGVCDTGATISGGAAECTLRAAIQEANSTPELDTIHFEIPGGGVRTILPGSALPVLTEPVIIDGTTQFDYSTTPMIEIDGTNAAGGEVIGLEVQGGNSTIRALAINSFPHTGLELKNKNNNLVEGNHIGTNAAGTVAKNNGYDGLAIIDSSLNIVGGTPPLTRNVISGNDEFGIAIEGGKMHFVQVFGFRDSVVKAKDSRGCCK